VAWGPSGEIDGGIDIRTKATIDAIEEIRLAKTKLDLKEEHILQTQEKLIIILKRKFESY